MIFKNFKYTKKKDGEKKNYFVLVFEEKDNHIEGIDLGKLSEEEIKNLIKFSIEKEALEKSFKIEAEKSNIAYEEYIAKENRNSVINELNEKLKPFIKKAYRRYLKSNIEELTH